MKKDIKPLVIYDQDIGEVIVANCNIHGKIKIVDCVVDDEVQVTRNVVGREVIVRHNVTNARDDKTKS